MWKIMKQCTDPIGAGCSHIYRRIYRYNPEIHGDLYLYNIYLNINEASSSNHQISYYKYLLAKGAGGEKRKFCHFVSDVKIMSLWR
jgi:hypothetical protein